MLLRRRKTTQADLPAGFDFAFEEVPVLVQAFRRMVRNLEFDICEMAMTTYVFAREHGGQVHGAADLPGARFPSRRHPVQHEGRHRHPERVRVNRRYTVITGVWARSIVQDEYSVDLSRITWVLSGDEHVAAGTKEYQPKDLRS